MATLTSDKGIGICVSDNSQMIKSLKFQRGGISSKFSLTTSRLFLKAMIPIFPSLIQWPEERVGLTYIDQKIPLPPGVPVYETIQNVTPFVFDGSTICSSLMDVSDEQVEYWAILAMMVLQIYRLQRLLKSDDHNLFRFQHEDNIHSMQLLKVNLKLQNNRSGFYQRLRNFSTMKQSSGRVTQQRRMLPYCLSVPMMRQQTVAPPRSYYLSLYCMVFLNQHQTWLLVMTQISTNYNLL